MILDPFFGPLRNRDSFDSIAEWLEDPQNNVPMFCRHYSDMDDKPKIRWVEFRRIEFGPIDGLFPQSWCGRMLMYTPFVKDDDLQLAFRGSGIEIGDLAIHSRGHHYVWNVAFVMLAEDFNVMRVLRALRDHS